MRIAVPEKSAYELYLSRTLKHAKLMRAKGGDAAFKLFVGEKLEALAGLRPRLVKDHANLRDSRIISGRFTPGRGAVARAFGGRGKLARNIEDVHSAAAEWVAKPGPMMIDARIARSVVTLPYRRIHYGRDE